uniref:Putative secreted protein n=1 Tax=Panstrongylus lignarius TaxID=156445 RepID=A0A224XU00_9HEMI
MRNVWIKHFLFFFFNCFQWRPRLAGRLWYYFAISLELPPHKMLQFSDSSCKWNITIFFERHCFHRQTVAANR